MIQWPQERMNIYVVKVGDKEGTKYEIVEVGVH